MKRRLLKKIITGTLLLALMTSSVPTNLYAGESDSEITSEESHAEESASPSSESSSDSTSDSSSDETSSDSYSESSDGYSNPEPYVQAEPSIENNTLEVSVTITPTDSVSVEGQQVTIVGDPTVGVSGDNEADTVSFVQKAAQAQPTGSDEEGGDKGTENGGDDGTGAGGNEGTGTGGDDGTGTGGNDGTGAGGDEGTGTGGDEGSGTGGDDGTGAGGDEGTGTGGDEGTGTGGDEGTGTGGDDGTGSGEEGGEGTDVPVKQPVYDEESDVKHNSKIEEGAGNYYEITFGSNDEDDTAKYTIYVAGKGVDMEVCNELMKNFLNSSSAPVINPNLVDTEKNSTYTYDEEGNLIQTYVKNTTGNADSIKTVIDIGGGEEAEVYYDSRLCWAMAASSVIYQTNWMEYSNAGIFNTLLEGYEDSENAIGYFQTSDDIADYARYCWGDEGNYTADFYGWLFSGKSTYENDELVNRTRFGYDANDALLSGYEMGYSYDYKDDIAKRVEDYNLKGNVLDMTGNPYLDDGSYFNYYSIINKELISDEVLKKLNYSSYWNWYNAETDESFYGLQMGDLTIEWGEGDSAGAHAITYNGYVTDEAGNVVAVIITDPDDSVNEEPNLGRDKSNQYFLQVIDYRDNKYYIGDLGEETDTYISGINYVPLVLSESSHTRPVYDITKQVKYPEVTSAIRESNIVKSEYNTNEDIEVALNFDFLEFYDIDKLKFTIKDSEGNDIRSEYLEYSKEYWRNCIDSGLESLKIGLGSIEGEAGTSYSAQLSIDSTCFNGNYGWFAERAKYSSDLLTDVLIKIVTEDTGAGDGDGGDGSSDDLNGGSDNDSDGDNDSGSDAGDGSDSGADNKPVIQVIPSDKDDDEGNSSDSNESGSAGNTNNIVTTPDADKLVFFYPVTGGETSDVVLSVPKDEEKKYTARDVSHDMFNALAGDEYLVKVFSSAGVDVSHVSLSSLDIAYSTKILSGNVGTMVVNPAKVSFRLGDNLFAAIRLSNGRVVYVKVIVLPNGNLVIQVPDNATEVSIFKVTTAF